MSWFDSVVPGLVQADRVRPSRRSPRSVVGLVIGIADRLAARDETGGRHRAPEQRFVRYRVALGIVIVALVSAGLLSPHAAESAN